MAYLELTSMPVSQFFPQCYLTTCVTTRQIQALSCTNLFRLYPTALHIHFTWPKSGLPP